MFLCVSFIPYHNIHIYSLLGTWLKRHHAFICLVIIWSYAIFWASIPFAGLGNYAPEPFGTSCTLDWWLAQASMAGQAFILNILFFCLIFPTAVIVFCYTKIIAKVKSSTKEVAHYDTRIQNTHVLEMKLTKVGVEGPVALEESGLKNRTAVI